MKLKIFSAFLFWCFLIVITISQNSNNISRTPANYGICIKKNGDCRETNCCSGLVCFNGDTCVEKGFAKILQKTNPNFSLYKKSKKTSSRSSFSTSQKHLNGSLCFFHSDCKSTYCLENIQHEEEREFLNNLKRLNRGFPKDRIRGYCSPTEDYKSDINEICYFDAHCISGICTTSSTNQVLGRCTTNNY